MTDSHRHDAVARALDLLPEDDPARSDPAFIGNVSLAGEARAARETAVDVWLTVSPLTAAPADILGRVMAQLPQPADLRQRQGGPRGGSSLRTALAISGWAAAIVFAFLWLGQDRVGGLPPVAGRNPLTEDPVVDKAPPHRGSGMEAPERTAPAGSDRGRKLQEEILRLRATLAREESLEKAPRIKGLSPPGSIPHHPGQARDHLRRMLVNALRSSLEAETGAPGDRAVLVIERGWPGDGIANLDDGATLRHRNFPEEHWQDLGLLRSEDGSYYDPGSGLIWTPDPEGRGFVGRRAAEGESLDHYHRKAGGAEPPEPTPFVQAEPSGFLIENPEDASVDVVIEGVSPAGEGEGHWFVWSLPDGTIHEQPVTSGMFTPSGTLVGNFSGNSINLPGGFNPGGTLNLELQTRSNTGAITGTILQTGGN